MSRKFILLTAILLAVSPLAAAGEGLTSTTAMVFDAVMQHEGVYFAPATAGDTPSPRYTKDYAPPQVLELRRPGGEPLEVGRLITSCSCLSASLEKRSFAPDEPAYVTVRVVKKPPLAGARYAIIAQVLAPQEVMVQYDMEVP